MTYTASEMREMVGLLDQHAEQASHVADARDYRIAAQMLRQAADAMKGTASLANMVADGNFNHAEAIALAKQLGGQKRSAMQDKGGA